MWDPELYQRYSDERSRAFRDLTNRIRVRGPHLVYDLGCGPGAMTASLSRRWPSAQVIGVDNDPTMLATAAEHANERVSFQNGDLASFLPPPETDIVVSNAAFQWIDGHAAVLEQLAARVPDHGCLAIQVPGNFSEPSHTIIRDLLAEPVWAQRLPDLHLPTDPVLDAAAYGELFARQGLTVDTWETTYNQILDGADPVLEWVRGSILLPVMDRLAPALQTELLDALRPRLAVAYPRSDAGIVFPFRRIFAIGHR